jgi:hypothetical protein
MNQHGMPYVTFLAIKPGAVKRQDSQCISYKFSLDILIIWNSIIDFYPRIQCITVGLLFFWDITVTNLPLCGLAAYCLLNIPFAP